MMVKMCTLNYMLLYFCLKDKIPDVFFQQLSIMHLTCRMCNHKFEILWKSLKF